RHYDLRALIDDIWIIALTDSECVLGMRLLSDHRGTGRPEQVAAALGFTSYPHLIRRVGLFLANEKSNQDV
ncbi:MAG: hypothetical protein J7L90_02975, partial [Dehalococcoidia bacterium]|nr:hypothetical protein [Dehalococcoidia bacterium]